MDLTNCFEELSVGVDHFIYCGQYIYGLFITVLRLCGHEGLNGDCHSN